jgi:hypothetical protein
MPQFDILSFFNQLTWLNLVTNGLYNYGLILNSDIRFDPKTRIEVKTAKAVHQDFILR